MNLSGKFVQWLWQFRIITSIATIVIFGQMVFWKYMYPYPNFLPDSYSYIEAAIREQHINKWPIGYSKFLWGLSFITRNHTALVWFQYILLQISIFYFLYTIWELLKPGKIFFCIMLFTAIGNPLTYQVSNIVSSDALFTTLSLIWFTQLLWILYKPSLYLLLVHAMVLVLAFSVRYNALYYPFISIALIVFIKIPNRIRITGISAILFLVSAFIGYTQYHYQNDIGRAQFSPFGGWQLASNALYAYAHVSSGQRVKLQYEARELQLLTDRHIDSLRKLTKRPDAQLGVYYLWNDHSPLIKNMQLVWRFDSTSSEFKRWALMGRRYKDFGTWLITNYPLTFVKFFIWPNLVNYYVPKIEFVGLYNMGNSTIDNIGKQWFKLSDNKVNSRIWPVVLFINVLIPVLLALINWVFILGFIGFKWLRGFEMIEKYVKQIFILLLAFWISNIFFSVLSSPIVLRYQLFPMMITQCFMLQIIAFYIKTACLIHKCTLTQKINQKDLTTHLQ
jgi:hypothetical protein